MCRGVKERKFNVKSISNVAARVSTAQDISPPPAAAKIGAQIRRGGVAAAILPVRTSGLRAARAPPRRPTPPGAAAPMYVHTAGASRGATHAVYRPFAGYRLVPTRRRRRRAMKAFLAFALAGTAHALPSPARARVENGPRPRPAPERYRGRSRDAQHAPPRRRRRATCPLSGPR